MPRIIEDQLLTLLLFFRVEPTMAANRLIGIVPSWSDFTTPDISNQAHLWDINRSTP